MPPETEVISCPACRHLLRVPLDWLGQPVQCPQCQARFQAPVRAGETLTEAVLLTPPESSAPPARKRLDPMLLLPAFGLLCCGVAGFIINGIQTYQFLADPVGSKLTIRDQLNRLRGAGLGADDPPDEIEKRDDERAAATVRAMRWILPAFVIVSAVVFLGGLSMALRWNYRLAQIGSVAAILNVAHLCCVPGAFAGAWGLLMLHSKEGREHFGR
jgi:hypothetical protein